VRLLFGKGILVLPFVFTFVGQHVLAGRVASKLSGMAQSIAVPLSTFVDARERFDPFAFDPTVAQVGGTDTRAPRDESEGDAPFEGESLEASDRRGAHFVSTKRGKHVGHRGSDRAGASAERVLPSIRVPEGTVLRLANSGRKPTGRPVPAEGRRPAGIQVFGASALGIGVRDGDVLTHVSEVPVSSVGQVVALVIAARGARQKAITGRLWRGELSYLVVVEQPYPREVARRKSDGCSDSGSGNVEGAWGEPCSEDESGGRSE
jgi:hypothetical protein